MIRTGDSNAFGNRPPDSGFNEEELAQPKGRQTRAAIATHLANKLKIGNMDLPDLMAYEKEIRANEEHKDEFWKKKLSDERLRLEKIRKNQEEELQRVIDRAKK